MSSEPAPIRALGDFDDGIAQETLAAIAMDDPDEAFVAEATKASSRIYDRLTGAWPAARLSTASSSP